MCIALTFAENLTYWFSLFQNFGEEKSYWSRQDFSVNNYHQIHKLAFGSFLGILVLRAEKY
jgi:hypothetical protein